MSVEGGLDGPLRASPPGIAPAKPALERRLIERNPFV